MAWFLSKNKSKKSGRKKASSLSTPKRGRKLLLITGVLVVIVASLAAGWYFGEQSLQDYVKATRPTAATQENVVIKNQPTWMHPRVAKDLRALTAGQLSADPFDNQSLSKAAGVLGQVPWVKEVRQVRRLADGRVEVDAVFREPFAVIEARDGFHLVDVEGFRLPGLYARENVPSPPLPLILGINSAPPGEAGRLWQGYDVRSAMTLVRLLEAQPFAKQIRAYNASKRDAADRVRLELLTKDGKIEWGYPPGEEMAVEVKPQVKIERLLYIASRDRQGRIDGGGKHLDITGTEIREFMKP